MSASERGPLVVVGDRFTEFLANRGTVAASALLLRLRSGAAVGPARFGQGATTEQRAELTRLLGADGEAPVAAARELTHKRDPKNTLISAPRALPDGDYEAELVLDERTETLSDHLTGQHVPALTLLEVARQMWTAVSEAFLLPTGTSNTRFVVLSMGGQFRSYVFPMPATVHYTLLDRAADGAGETFTCRIEVRHGDRVAVQMHGEYRVVPEAVAAKQESLAARRELSVQLAAVTTGRGPTREERAS